MLMLGIGSTFNGAKVIYISQTGIWTDKEFYSREEVELIIWPED